MTANPETLAKMSKVIKAELPKYLSEEFAIHDVTAQNQPGPDDEHYVHVRVILEDDHPKLDPRLMNRFNSDMYTIFDEVGIDHPPNISYANRSQLGL